MKFSGQENVSSFQDNPTIHFLHRRLSIPGGFLAGGLYDKSWFLIDFCGPVGSSRL
jgi:hypothetical protein